MQVLFIDEAHFLPDLTSFCADVAKSKRVYVAGLDLDYRKQRFGQVPSCCMLQTTHGSRVQHVCWTLWNENAVWLLSSPSYPSRGLQSFSIALPD